jgi:hypothetical protein
MVGNIILNITLTNKDNLLCHIPLFGCIDGVMFGT